MNYCYRIRGGCALLGLLLAPLGHAQQPLSIEQLLVGAGSWQLASALDYRSGSGVSALQQRQQRLTTALRYGFNRRLEINARLHRDSVRVRLPESAYHHQRTTLSSGVNWLLKPESRLPALLVEGRADLYSDDSAGSARLPGAQFIATAYQSFDPLVLSLTASVEWRDAYRSEGQRRDPGGAWSLSGQVNFAVNHRVTLLGGWTMTRRDALRINGREAGRSSETLGLQAGLGFTPGPRHTLFVSGDYNNSGTAGLSLRWLYAL